MKKLHKYVTLTALLMLLGLSAAQAATVSEGFKTGDWVEFGSINLDPGSYSLDLLVFGTAAPTIFGIANASEAYQVSVPTFGFSSTPFTTLGGLFSFLVGGSAGAATIYQASITQAPVPLPPALGMLGAGLVGLVTIGRRKLAA